MALIDLRSEDLLGRGIREAGIEQPLSVEELGKIGWPSAPTNLAATRTRVHVTTSRLRKAGLQGILVFEGLGYLLAPDVPCLRASEES